MEVSATKDRVNLNFQEYEKDKCGMYVKEEPEQEGIRFLPIQEVKVDVTIVDSIATTKVDQVFYNPDTSTEAIEVQYKFPMIQDAIVTKMVFTLDDRTIETQVEEKQRADEKYDDATAAGKMAVKMNQSKDNQGLYEIDIGNIKAGQKVHV